MAEKSKNILEKGAKAFNEYSDWEYKIFKKGVKAFKESPQQRYDNAIKEFTKAASKNINIDLERVWNPPYEGISDTMVGPLANANALMHLGLKAYKSEKMPFRGGLPPI